MRRRDFIGLAGGAVGWPLGALAQQGERMRRIGVLANLPENDPVEQSRFVAFQEALKQFGWAPGRNLRIDYRSTVGDAERTRRFAAELVALAEDCILAVGGAVMASLQEATSTVPVVFVLLPDPVGGGVVQSLSHPGGNATGFTPFEYGISGKWLELLKEIAPLLTRVAVIRDPASPEGPAQFASIQAVAPLLGIDISPIGVRNPKEIESAIAAFAGSSKNAGLAVTGSALTAVHYKLIVTLAARYKLPAAYFNRFFVDAGGLISYGPDFVEQYRRAAGYVDRILRGEKPADLPVQAPTKYDLVINLRTAKALGLNVPPSLIARADDLIE